MVKLSVFHEIMHRFEVVSTLITQLSASRVNLVIEATSVLAANVAAVLKVSAGFVSFVGLSDMFCQVNLVDEVHITRSAYITGFHTDTHTHPLISLRDCLPPRGMSRALVFP